MAKVLSPVAIEQYHRDGYIHPLRVISPDEAAQYRAKLEAFETRNGGPIGGNYRQKTHLLFTWANELVHHPVILDAVEDVFGPDILCWSSGFFNKEAATIDYVSWHQDATYWGLSSSDVLTAWVALTPSNTENGCMRVIPGTHKEQVAHQDTFADHNLLTRGQEIAVEVDEAQAVDIVLEPGEISLHNVLIFHGSGPNPSADRRIGYAIRYIKPHVKQIVGSRDSATLVRGEYTQGHLELEPSPERDLDPAMLAYHKEITERSAKVLYRGTGRTSF